MRPVIRHLLFDLDNTLYPAGSGFEQRIVERMTSYAAAHLGLPLEQAQELRKERLSRYGTTLEWLQREHGPLDPEVFYAAVHPEGEESILAPDPELRRLLECDPLPKTIFTNAPAEHAQRVLTQLDLDGIFGGIYDIRFSAYRGKPAREAFERILAVLGESAENVAFFDDSPRAVMTFRAMGGHGFLVDDLGIHRDSGLESLPSIHHYIKALERIPTFPLQT